MLAEISRTINSYNQPRAYESGSTLLWLGPEGFLLGKSMKGFALSGWELGVPSGSPLSPREEKGELEGEVVQYFSFPLFLQEEGARGSKKRISFPKPAKD